MRPEQITSGSLKLSIEPHRYRTHIELTDYETDITWLSGPVYMTLTFDENPSCSFISGEADTLSKSENSLTLTSRIGDLGIVSEFHFADSPQSLTFTSGIHNGSGRMLTVAHARIAPSWSPPESWWKYWAYWKISKLQVSPTGTDIDPGRKLCDIRDEAVSAIGKGAFVPMALLDEKESAGCIVHDGRRYLLVTSGEIPGVRPISLDITSPGTEPMFLIDGFGVTNPARKGPIALNPGESIASVPTILVPGSGTLQDAVDIYQSLREQKK